MGRDAQAFSFLGGYSVDDSAVQSDGKIIIVGDFWSYGGVSVDHDIARLNSDGSLDASFNADIPGNATHVAIQPDGKILVVGSFITCTVFDGTGGTTTGVCPSIVRLNIDGSLDTSFSAGTGFTNGGYSDYLGVISIVVQSDGKIIVAGGFDKYNGVSVNVIMRLNSNGSIDNTFNLGFYAGSGTMPFVRDIALQTDGKIVVGNIIAPGIVRLNTNGTVDNTFSSLVTWPGYDNSVSKVFIQSDGKIIVNSGLHGDIIIRLNSDGTVDTSFSFFDQDNGYGSYAMQADNKLIVGHYNGSTNSLVRVNSDGSIDNSFSSGGTMSGISGSPISPIILTSSIQSDGKIIIGGYFGFYNNITRNHLARINTDGSNDSSFNRADVPSITTSSTTTIKPTSAYGNGNISDTGGENPVRMIEWGLSSGVYTSSCSAGMGGIGSFSCKMSGLIPSTTYYVRAKATNSGGTNYGTEVTFQTSPPPVLPVVTTGPITRTLGSGTIISTGGEDPERFIEWGTVSGIYTNSCTAGVGGVDSYSCPITGLSPNTTYYARAKATNYTGTSYGDEVSFSVGAGLFEVIIPNEFQGGGIAQGWRADESTWAYELPFDFPFYGTTYSAGTSIGITSNGQICLEDDTDCADYLNNIGSTDHGPFIAPLWFDLDSTNTGGVYITENVDNVIIRWATEEYGVSGVTINFEAILFDNGNIKFNYGSQTSSLTSVGASVGISKGDGNYVASIYNNAINFNLVNTSLWVDVMPTLPTVDTVLTSNIGMNNARANGNLSSTGNVNTTRYMEWGTVSGTYTSSCTAGTGGVGAYACDMTGLTPNTTYYVRAKATNYLGTAYGTEMSFQTAPMTASLVTTNAITSIAVISAIGNGDVINTGGENPTREIQWGTASGTYTNSCSAGVGGVGVYSCSMTGLSLNTTYYVRAKATNSIGISYGDEVSFTTLNIPTVTTQDVSDVAAMTATGNGTIVDTGGANPTRYIEWGTTSGTYTNSCSAGVGAIGIYTCNMTGLTPNTTYYVRAKATNSAGTSYGAEMTFTTATITLPAVITDPASFVTSLSVRGNGNITAIGNDNPTREIEWGTVSGTYTNSCSAGVGGVGTYYCLMANLSPSTTYYVRAKITNLAGTVYGSELNFTTTALSPMADLANNYILGAATQSDGKTVIVGRFSTYNGSKANYIARLNIDGTLDNTFNTEVGAGNIINAVALQSDGKIIIGGDFTSYNGVYKPYLARLNTDGTLDTTFVNTGAGNSVYSLAIQSDNKIVVGGNFTTLGGTARARIGRLNADGSLDSAFVVGTGASSYVRTIAIGPDGKIIIGGDFISYNGTARNRIARLNTNGSLDTTFTVGTGVGASVYASAVQSDGKIIIGGGFTAYNGTTVNRIARLNIDGTLDLAFNLGTGLDNFVYSMAVQSDGKIIIGGNFTTYNGTAINRIARLNIDGTVDTTFGVGMGAGSFVMAIAIKSDGKIIIAGYLTTYNGISRNRIAFLNSDGTDDVAIPPVYAPTVNTNPITSFTGIAAIAIGNIINTGGINPTREIEWGTVSGTYTGSCTAGVGATGTYSCNMTGLTPNTTYYVRAKATNSAGTSYGSEISFTTYNTPTVTTQDVTAITAIYATGNGTIVDTGGVNPTRYIEWGTTSGTYPSSCNASTGAVGAYTCTMTGLAPNTTYYFRAKAVSTAGTAYGAELSFQTAPVTAPTLNTNAVTSIKGNSAVGNGNITYTGGENPTREIEWGIASGVYTSSCSAGTGAAGIYNCAMTGLSNYTTYYVRAKATNSIGVVYGSEVSFATSATVDLANAAIYVTDLQSDGKIIIGGDFTSYNGTAINRIARLNIDGTLDTTFNVGTGVNSTINTIAIQADGKILIGGAFTSYNGTAINRIARLNADGTLDILFTVGTGASGIVRAISLQSDGEIIIGGDFTTYNSTARNRIARLNTDGTLDTAFIVGTGASNTVSELAIQSDGKIIIGGNFTTYNSISRNRIARLNTDGTLDTTFTVGTGAGSYVRAVSIQSDGKIIIGGSFTTYNSITRNRIARLNTDGTLDTTFNPGTGPSSDVYGVTIQPDGKIIIGGAFTTYGGVARSCIARINTNGTLDTTFIVGTGANNYVYSATVQSDNKIIIGGSFTTYNGVVRNYIARLNADGTIDVIFGETPHAAFVASNAATVVTDVSATINGNILNTGGDNPERIIEWGTVSGTYADSCTVGVGGIGVYSCNLTGLTSNTTYYFRAKSINIYGTSYGSELSFATAYIPTVTTQDVSSILPTTAVGNGAITDNGNQNPTRYIQWGTTSGVYTNSCNAGTGGVGVYTCNMTGLLANTTYYAQAMATNLVGTAYGSEVSFTTPKTTPTVTTQAASTVTSVSAIGNGTITATGGEGPERMIEWGTTSGVYTDSCTAGIGEAGTYSCAMNNLTVSTTYYFRTKATNSMGTTYGSEMNLFAPSVSAVSTRNVSTITATQAGGNGYIVSTGGQNPTREIEWGTVSGTYTNSCSAGVGGVGLYSCNMTGLTSGVTYYLRAKSTNGAGIIYGEEKSFVAGNYDDVSLASYMVNATVVQPDGKVIIGGGFEEYNRFSKKGIARLNADGTLDHSFQVGEGFMDDSLVFSLALQTDGKILVGGYFRWYNGFEKLSLVRLNIDGTLDHSFMGRVDWNDDSTGEVYSIVIQPDGKILVGGYFNRCSGAIRNNIARLNADGSIDTTFIVNDPILEDTYDLESMALQPDGKIIVGGGFCYYNAYYGRDICNVLRLNADGSLDTTFNADDSGYIYRNVYSVAVQTDGKILVGGYLDYNIVRNNIIRLNADGSRDNTFNAVSGANNDVYDIKIQPDGKIIIVGYFTTYNGTSSRYIARINADGSIDSTFDLGTGLDGFVESVTLQSDGKILVGGNFYSYNGNDRPRIARINIDGSLDIGFGKAELPEVQTQNASLISAIEARGNIELIGAGGVDWDAFVEWGTQSGVYTHSCDANAGYYIRTQVSCNMTGLTPGTTYYYRAKATNVVGTSYGIEKSFVAGDYNITNLADNGINSLAHQSDGKIIIGGWFQSYNGVSINRIARLTAYGLLDTTFNPGTGANSYVKSIAVQSDGKILIAGEFTTYNDVTVNGIARINTDGTLDTSFNSGTGIAHSYTVYSEPTIDAVALQPDGKIVIGGWFESYNGTARNYIARLNTDGTLDTSFNPGTGTDDSVDAIVLQSDGKIIIGGWFQSYNGTNRSCVARLNADGSLDTTFNPKSVIYDDYSSDRVLSMAVQPDGKVIIGGDFNTNELTWDITRLNTDGSRDLSFNPGTGANYYGISTIAVQSDGKILVGGDFNYFQETDVGYMVRLNSNGSIDSTFDSGNGIMNSVSSSFIQSDGKILIAGYFSQYNGTIRGNIARLNSDGSLDTSFFREPTSLPILPSTAPTLSTITSNFATATSSITATGGEDPTREIEWGTVSGTYTNSCSAGVGTIGDYSCNMTSLIPETTYFVRGKATNSAGVSHTIETSFTTLADIGPQLILPTPSNNAAEVLVGINIVSKFDRIVEKGNGKIHIKKKSDDSIIEEIDVQDPNITGWGTDTLTIDPTNDLPGNTEIYINIDPTALVDSLGNFFFGISDNSTWTFTTGAGAGPQIVTPYPTDNATNISPDSNLTINFDRPVEVGTGNIDIINATDDSIIETIDITSGNVTGWSTDTLTINPTNNLPSNTPIYINIDPTAIVDTLGNYFFGITDNTTWTFTTGSTVGPQIILPTPANNAADVQVNINIVSKFDRIVEKGTGKIHIKKKSDDSIIEEIDVEDSNITGWGTDTLTIDPTNDLPGNTEIYINIEPTALVDSLNNYFFGITDSTTWTFTTQYIGPQIITPLPADNATNIDPTADLTINFDRPVEVGTGDIDIINATDDSIIETIDITSENVTGWSTDTLTINPTNDLPGSTEIYINIDPTAIVDTLGNYFFGITDNSSWSFTTGGETTEGPQIIAPTPSDDATNIALDADLVINFDRPVEPGTGTIDIIETEDNSIIEEIDVNSDNITGWGTDTLTINPTDNLPADTNIYVNIEPGAILDTLGNFFFGINDNSTWSFRTGDASTVGPQLILPTPANNSTNISPDADLITKFDRPVYPGEGNFHIKNKEDNSEIETIDVNSSSITGWGTDTLTINPTNDIPVNTEVFITIDSGALKDISGSFFFGITDSATWSFITGDIDNDLEVEILNVKDIEKDKVKVRVEVKGNNKEDEKFDFKVEIKNKDDDTKDKVKIKKVKVSEADKATLEISQLLPNTSYSLAVSVSEVGEDDFSKVSDAKSITTLEDLEKLEDTLTETQPITGSLEDTLITNEEGEEREPESEETPVPVVNSLEEDDNNREDKKETISAAVTTTLAVIGLIPALTNAFATTTIPFLPLTPGVLRAPFLLRLFNASRRKFLSALRFFPILTISSNDKRSIPFDRKENNKFWGVVFDSYTKQPIMDAVVYLVSLDKKRVIEHVVTDEQGRYGFLIGETGKYALEVKKGIYQIATTTKEDSLYGNIYTQPIDFNSGDLFHLNVALVAPNFNWHKFSQDVLKRYNSFFFKFLSYLLDAIYVAGMILSIYNVIYYPSFFNYLALAFYIGLLIFRVIFKDKKKFGIVSKKETKSPLPFTVVALHDIVNKQRLNFAVTDVLGRYYLLAKNGSYALKLKYIDMTGGSYEKEGVANVEKGIFKKDFEV
ncbi:MAG: Ig-like domain-containing protein [Candidatus Moraniibacteriota bacterium]